MWVLGVLLPIIALGLGTSFYAYNRAFYSPKNRRGGLEFPNTKQYLEVKDVMQKLVDEIFSSLRKS